MFVRTTAISKMLAITKRKRVIQGGTSAGKTYGIIPILIDRAIKTPNLEISIVSESFPHLRRGALKDFIKIMKETNRYIPQHHNRSAGKYTFYNGSYIEFFSVEQEEKVRGARRNILYVNEANNIKFETYYQLAIRTNMEIWIDYNPTAEFWAHTEVLKDKDAELLILTYKDNEALSDTIVKEIEKAKEKAKTSKYWANWWQVYGLGKIGSLQGVVLSNWEQTDKIPIEARYIGSGLDFGYSADPTTLIDVYLFNGKYIYDEVIYQTGLLNKDIAKLCKPFDRIDKKGKAYTIRRNIYADSAEPKSIDEIARHGISITGADKGRDSIIFGLTILQENPFLVTSKSVNLIKELRAYVWDTDKTGKQLNKPIDMYDHTIDAMRYFAIMRIGRNRKIDIR